MAVKVLPLPVAIWINARGLLVASDFSRFRIAMIWAGQSLRSPQTVTSSGIWRTRARNVAGANSAWLAVAPAPVASAVVRGVAVSHSASVPGWWKAKTLRARGSGSRPLVKWVSTPVDSYRNGKGRRQAGSGAG